MTVQARPPARPRTARRKPPADPPRVAAARTGSCALGNGAPVPAVAQPSSPTQCPHAARPSNRQLRHEPGPRCHRHRLHVRHRVACQNLAMAGLARDAGLAHLIAPVRPTLKDRYPTIPIERYARWTRADGTPFDPWMRVHTRLGARIGPAIPRSLHIAGTVGDWESWTGMPFPETGDYVFPAGLAPVHIDRDNDTYGVYPGTPDY